MQQNENTTPNETHANGPKSGRYCAPVDFSPPVPKWPANRTQMQSTEKGAMPPPMPTRKGKARAPDETFTLIIDTREQTPFVFPGTITTTRGTLHTGDYSIVGYEDRFTIERKSLADLVQTIIHNRARFERELERMRPFDFRRVIVTAPFMDVARGNYAHSHANPRAVVASIAAFEVRYNVPFIFAADKREAQRRVEQWARMYVREQAVRKQCEKLAAAQQGGHPTPPPPPVGVYIKNNNPPAGAEKNKCMPPLNERPHPERPTAAVKK